MFLSHVQLTEIHRLQTEHLVPVHAFYAIQLLFSPADRFDVMLVSMMKRNHQHESLDCNRPVPL